MSYPTVAADAGVLIIDDLRRQPFGAAEASR
jgi:hypothetical protein